QSNRNRDGGMVRPLARASLGGAVPRLSGSRVSIGAAPQPHPPGSLPAAGSRPHGPAQLQRYRKRGAASLSATAAAIRCTAERDLLPAPAGAAPDARSPPSVRPMAAWSVHTAPFAHAVGL